MLVLSTTKNSVIECHKRFFILVLISQQQQHQQQSFNSLFHYNPGEPAPELSKTMPLIVLKFLTSTPNLPSQASQTTSVV